MERPSAEQDNRPDLRRDPRPRPSARAGTHGLRDRKSFLHICGDFYCSKPSANVRSGFHKRAMPGQRPDSLTAAGLVSTLLARSGLGAAEVGHGQGLHAVACLGPGVAAGEGHQLVQVPAGQRGHRGHVPGEAAGSGGG